jgi:hypothetical protein
VVGLLLLGAAAACAVLLAASARLPSVCASLLVAYVAFVANLGGVTWLLSPLRAVNRTGLAVAEVVLLAAAAAAWWLRGRPWPRFAGAGRTVAEILRDPACALFAACVAALLVYELVLALTVPANNWDTLTYHLPRAAAWLHHGGIYWIPNPPTPNFNEFPPLAEQQILYTFVGFGSGALYALPQFLAQLAILVAVYGGARRLGFGARAAACSGFLFATFSLVALQSSIGQNDVFAASFPAVAACLILGGSAIELAVAGVAAGIGLGAKPTTALVLPVLLWLVVQRGRRATVVALGGGLAGFAAVGMWSYVLNLAHTGRLFGKGGWTHIGASDEQSIRPGHLATATDVVYQFFDNAVLTDHDIWVLELVGIGAALTAAVVTLVLSRRVRRAAVEAGSVAVPFFAPLLVIGASGVLAWFAKTRGFPVRGHLGNYGGVNRNVGYAVFGPVGAVTLFVVPVLTIVAYVRRRVDGRRMALACAFPVFLFLLSFATYNWFLIRFLLVPAALTAPLLAMLFRSRLVTLAYLGVAAFCVSLVVTSDFQRPLDNPVGDPWALSQVQAMALSDEPDAGRALAVYDKLVPTRACVGAVLDPNEPAYILSGPRLRHPVYYLPVERALASAYERHLSYVVVTNGVNRWAAKQFAGDGWRVRSLAGYWQLAIAPHAGPGDC